MKKKIKKIDEQKIYCIVKETLEKFIKTNGGLDITNRINVGNIITIKNDIEFNKWADKVWDMLELSYADVGGLQSYRDFNDFVKKRHIIEIVISEDGNLLSCATYRRIEGSLKLTAIGCDQSQIGKLALEQIIQNNIINSDLHYWAEVSGAIEHYFKKHNGFPMPNTLASKILQINENDIKLSNKDKVHYSRPIGINREYYTKMIFGIKSEEIFQQAIQEVENYGNFMKEVNNLTENKNIYTVKQAIYIIENIYRAHEEDGFNELIPSWYNALKCSLQTLTNVPNKNETINDYIEYAKYLLDDMQVLELHSIMI